MVREPRPVSELIAKIVKERGDNPDLTSHELATILGSTVEKINEALEARYNREHVSLDALWDPNDPQSGLRDTPGVDEVGYSKVESVQGLKIALTVLSDLDREVLVLRLQGVNQAAIARKCGGSQMAISRRLKRIFATLGITSSDLQGD